VYVCAYGGVPSRLMLGRSPFNLSHQVIIRLIILVRRGRKGNIEAPVVEVVVVVDCRLEIQVWKG